MADNGQRQDTTAQDARTIARMIEDEAFEARIMRVEGDAGTRRETTAQRDMRLRGTKRFNAYGCK